MAAYEGNWECALLVLDLSISTLSTTSTASHFPLPRVLFVHRYSDSGASLETRFALTRRPI